MYRGYDVNNVQSTTKDLFGTRRRYGKYILAESDPPEKGVEIDGLLKNRKF